VPAADRLHPEPGRGELLAGPDRGDLHAVDVGVGRRVHRHPEAGQPERVDVVGVLVGDQHRVGAGQRPRLAPLARVDDQDAAVLLDPHAGMRVLGDLHVRQPTLPLHPPGTETTR
jgi:hypothetical protein